MSRKPEPVQLTRGGRQAEFYDGGDPFDDEPAWEQDGFSDDVSEAEEVEDLAEATADVADKDSDEVGENRDADDE